MLDLFEHGQQMKHEKYISPYHNGIQSLCWQFVDDASARGGATMEEDKCILMFSARFDCQIFKSDIKSSSYPKSNVIVSGIGTMRL